MGDDFLDALRSAPPKVGSDSSPKASRSPSNWPFPSISEADVRRLSPAQRGKLEGALALAISQLRLGVDVAPTPARPLPKGGEWFVRHPADDAFPMGIPGVAPGLEEVQQPNVKTLRERLAFALQKTGINQSELARRIGVSRGAVSLWLNTDSEMTAPTNAKAARALNVDPNWLATGCGKGPSGKFDKEDPYRSKSAPASAAWPFPAIPRERLEALAKDPVKLEQFQRAILLAFSLIEAGVRLPTGDYDLDTNAFGKPSKPANKKRVSFKK